jgi:hypothetical protein
MSFELKLAWRYFRAPAEKFGAPYIVCRQSSESRRA